MDKFIKDKIRVTCSNLKDMTQKVVYQVPELLYTPCEYKKPQEKPTPDASWMPFKRHDRVCGRDKHFWFYAEVKTPPAKEGTQLILDVITDYEGSWDASNPQGILYLNGKLAHGLDINHHTAVLEPDTDYQLLLYFYTGTNTTAAAQNIYMDVMLDIKSVDLAVKDLYYDLRVPYDAAMCFEESDYSHIRTIKHLEAACNLIDFRQPQSDEFYKSIAAARAYLKEEYYGKECGMSESVVNMIGHTHIDVAWQWTLAQTREKVQRSFSTVIDLMKRYPEYVFMSSQPKLYAYLKEEEPELYEEIKEKIKEGRWEAEGAMWLEADCNLSSGESLIRQVFHGKKFMKDEFGVDSHILWLPDVFGYSAAMPQILQKSGVDQFVTSKISWNESNCMPYDSFMWEGIDGTEIFTYFLTAQRNGQMKNGNFYTTYVGMVSPSLTLGTWERYQQKEYNTETIVTFGYGDGGGGPTEDMLETQRRLEYGLPGIPKTQISRAGDFLARVEKNFHENCEKNGRIPKWVGELYLEFHRGTYTSIAKNKKNNRDCEFLCQSAETLAVTDNIFNGTAYPEKTLYDSWEIILLNQFHDIIPGSSIFEVYEDSDKQYAQVREEVGKIKSDALSGIADKVSEKGFMVYNPNSFTVSDYAEYNGETVYVSDVPPLGYKVVSDFDKLGNVAVSDKKIESEHYVIIFDDNMNIVSLFDKDNGREVVKDGAAINQLKIFEDYPREYDNWEISNYYKQKMWELNDVESVTPISGNGYGGFEIKRRYMSSTVTQQIIAYTNSRRIDFKTVADWHEHHVLLKAVFPTTIHSSTASYEIQFGNVERPTHENTSWDQAKFEVCAQKWSDLSEEGYGLSLLNDCKYGHSTFGSEMTITLIKCGTFPNPLADQGIHEFTYSLYPHKDGFKQGGTIEEAYKLNRPLEIVTASGNGSLPSEFSLVKSDCENIIIETVKAAHDGNGIVVRMYDAWNKKTTPEIKLGFDAKKISLCNMLEEPICELGSGNTVKVPVSNFEIVTLLIER